MTTDAATLHRLAGELDDLGRRLTHVGAELRAVHPTDPASSASATGQPTDAATAAAGAPPAAAAPPSAGAPPAAGDQPAAGAPQVALVYPPAPGYPAASGPYPGYSTAQGMPFRPGYYPYPPYAAPYAAQYPAGATHPSTPQPGTAQPVAQQPGDVQPAAEQPGDVQPAAGQSGTGQPSAGQSATAQPAAGLSTAGQPGDVQPGSDQSAYVQPGSDQPSHARPAAEQPNYAQPHATYPGYAPHSGYAQPAAGPTPAPQPPAGYPQPYLVAPYGRPPYTPPPTLRDRLGREGAGSRLLAWIGGAVTLLGVVLLLILAIQRGWLGPLPRVAVGAGFGGILVGAGAWLYRKPAARTGAFALAATGIATLYLDTIAATSLYNFLPVPAGLAVGLVIAVGGVLLAVKWEFPLLANAVVGACGVCAPLITRGFTYELVTFLLMIQIATVPVHLRRSWWPLSFTAAIPPLTAVLIGTGLRTMPIPAVIAAGVVSAGIAMITLRRNDTEPFALAVLGLAPLPILIAALLLPKPESAYLAGGTAVVLLATWTLVRGNSGTVAGIAGLVAAMLATLVEFEGGAILLGEAVVLAFVAKFTRNRFALGGSLAFAVMGVLFAIGSDVTPVMLLVPRAHSTNDLLIALASAALLLAASITLPWAAIRLDVGKSAGLGPWLPAGLCALYGAAGIVLSGSLLAIPGRAGFLVGHTLVTVSWTVAAFVLLLRGIKVIALRITGLVLVAAAVAKLVLFDLAALDGLARVGAFLGAGLILLVAGARYAKVVASR